jgi:putative ABC transport system ATP-binding protein
MIRLRRTQIGFVFQQGQLLPFLSMEENLQIVGRNSGLRPKQVRGRIDRLLSRLQVSHLRGKRPRQASRGEQQRIAVARALVHGPAIILADEPTAALDWENGEIVVQLLTQLAEDEEKVLLTVTHDVRLAKMFRRCFYIEQGRVYER